MRMRGGRGPGRKRGLGLLIVTGAATAALAATLFVAETPRLVSAGLSPSGAEAADAADRNRPGRSSPRPETVSGRARVIDGDTLELAGRRIRLEGIDAPERSQFCQGRTDQPWPCGAAARSALMRRVEGRTVRCEVRGRDRYQRDLARCFVGAEDLGGWLVSQGLAQAYRRYSTDYVALEEAARARRVGAWDGSFEPPENYRRRRRNSANDLSSK